MRFLTRSRVGRLFFLRMFRFWRLTGRAFGYYYQVMEAYGSEVADSSRKTVRLPNGCLMTCDLRDHVERQIFFIGVYEPIESYLFSTLIQPGWTVFDVGANVGQYSLMASTAVQSQGAVHAFEPIPQNYMRASEHITMNNLTNIQLNTFAAWHEETELELGQSADMTDNAGTFSVGAKVASAAIAFRVKAKSLDQYVSEQGVSKVNLVKMDIEGAELSALRGFQSTLKRDRPIVLMEINPAACKQMDYQPSDLWKLLVDELGYRAWKIGYSAQDWQEVADPSTLAQCNCFFTPGELPEALRQPWTFRQILAWSAKNL
jgi:FkbM family methyltransferase